MLKNKITSVDFLEVCVLNFLIKIYLMMNIDAMGKMGVCFLTKEEGPYQIGIGGFGVHRP